MRTNAQGTAFFRVDVFLDSVSYEAITRLEFDLVLSDGKSVASEVLARDDLPLVCQMGGVLEAADFVLFMREQTPLDEVVGRQGELRAKVLAGRHNARASLPVTIRADPG